MKTDVFFNIPNNHLEILDEYQATQRKHFLQYVNTTNFSPFLSSFKKEKYRVHKYHLLSPKLYELMGEALLEGLRENQFELYYQPFIDFHSQKVFGVEALIRWNHPQWGLIPPDKFIPVAEKNGFIIPLGEWIFQQACLDMKEFLSYPLTVAINISPYQLNDTFFIKNMIKTLKETQFPHNNLILEITEGNLLESSSHIKKQLIKLKKMNICLALDDFGTGYAGLKYLTEFPFDMIKIDKVFVDNVIYKPKQMAIVKNIIALSRSLGLTIHAEGIENHQDLNFLQCEGVSQGQGYLFSKPLSVSDLYLFLK